MALPMVGGFEHLGEITLVAGIRALNTAWHGASALKAAEAVRIAGRVANRQNVINASHIEAALKEASGVVVTRSDGKAFDHIGELKEAAAGLKNDLVKTKELLGSGKLDEAATAAAQNALSQSSKLLDLANAVLNKVKEIKVCTGTRLC
jgi:putative RNase toxin 28 of polymorphic toxin system